MQFSFALDKRQKIAIIKSMRKLLIILCFCLAACSTIEERQANTILAMSKPKSLSTLQGKTPEEIRKLMGNPTFVRKENPNESWVFKAPDCAVFVFFGKDGIVSYMQSKGACDKKTTHQLLRQRTAGS